MSDQQERATTASGTTRTMSLLDRWKQAVAMLGTSPLEALGLLESIQKDISVLGLFSTNENMTDVGSKSIPLLNAEYYMAMAHLNCPQNGNGRERKAHLEQGMNLFALFLQRLEQYELLNKEQTQDYQDLLELHDNNNNSEDAAPSFSGGTRNRNITREQKIARYRAKQSLQEEIQKLEALQQRRGRLGISDASEEMDGYDEESLERSLALKLLQIHTIQAIDEWHQAQREIPMVNMMIQAQEQQRHGAPQAPPARPPPPSNKPLQLTHITKDSGTGQLVMKKEEIRSNVFRPSWNQPTMTLAELGELEVQQAKERQARQEQAELQQKQQPRRYQQLVEDGMEDDANLVDASAKMDRDWDDFKDANPRGSGNKMGDRGDRNF